jgi:hypothetical protein
MGGIEMKRLAVGLAAGVLLLAASTALAQYKPRAGAETTGSSAIIDQSVPSTLFGWFDASKFSMHHTLSYQMSTFGGQSMSMGMYTNTMTYQFADNFDARADVSMNYSPSFQFSGLNGRNNSNFSGVYLSNAQLSYRPWENVKVQLQYSRFPYSSYYYSPFGGFYYGGSGF